MTYDYLDVLQLTVGNEVTKNISFDVATSRILINIISKTFSYLRWQKYNEMIWSFIKNTIVSVNKQELFNTSSGWQLLSSLLHHSLRNSFFISVRKFNCLTNHNKRHSSQVCSATLAHPKMNLSIVPPPKNHAFVFDKDKLFSVVEEVLAIAGGFGDPGFYDNWTLIMPGGRECIYHDLSNIPVHFEGFGLAQAYERYIFFCGGRSGQYTCKSLFSGFF